MDEKDRLILSALQDDAKVSLSALGGRVALTRMSVFSRIKSLKEHGVIEGSYYRINSSMVDRSYLMVVQVSFDVSGPDQEKVARKIAELNGVQSVYLNFGPWDMLLIARRSNKESAKNLVYEISRLPGVRNTLTMIPHTVIKESSKLDLEEDR
ncbi:MAG TPA: Lrp/AsnC family transcriptional regulator [Nitrososphaerales archaeon]|nr:Lrp/AsnC family transcriptional regulator [Nitrososphaerales archaeon]